MADWVTELLKDYIGDIDYIVGSNGKEKINCVLRRHVYADQNKERESIYRKVLECMAELADSCEPAIRLEKKQRTTQERQFFFRRMFTWVLVRVYEDFKDIEPYIEYRDTFLEMLDDALLKRKDDEKKMRAKLKRAKRTIKEYLQIYNWVGPKEDEPSFYKLSEKEKADLIADHPKAVRFSKVDTEYLNKQLIIKEYNKGSEFVKYEPVFFEKLSQTALNHIYALFLCDVEKLFFANALEEGENAKLQPQQVNIENEYENMFLFKENAEEVWKIIGLKGRKITSRCVAAAEEIIQKGLVKFKDIDHVARIIAKHYDGREIDKRLDRISNDTYRSARRDIRTALDNMYGPIKS